MTTFLIFLGFAMVILAIVGLVNPTLIIKKANRKQWLGACIVGCLIFIIGLSATPSNAPETQNQQGQQTATAKTLDIGQSGVIRVPGDEALTTVMLSPTNEKYPDLMRAIQAKDGVGLLEQIQGGAFAAPIGAEVLVIDRALGMRKVRITNTQDKEYTAIIGRAGWLPMEWASAK